MIFKNFLKGRTARKRAMTANEAIGEAKDIETRAKNVRTAIERALSLSPEPMDPDEQLQLELMVLRGMRAAQKLSHHTALSRGWHLDSKTGKPVKRNFGETVALMHTELSEALEADRRDSMDARLPHRDGREVKFADLILRVLETAETLGMDVGAAFIEKNRFNVTRPDHELEARNQPGGKKY